MLFIKSNRIEVDILFIITRIVNNNNNNSIIISFELIELKIITMVIMKNIKINFFCYRIEIN